MTLNLVSHRLSSLEGASSTVSCGSPRTRFELLIHIFTDGAGCTAPARRAGYKRAAHAPAGMLSQVEKKLTR